MKSRLPKSSKILFISDVHLGAFSEAKNQRLEQELIQLIDFAEEQQYQIAVLGDLFDYWIEYPGYVPPLGKKLLARFETFHQENKSSLYITGNHDNWTLGYFSDIGFEVEPEGCLLSIDGCNILLAHGDAIGESIETLERPFFHRIIRSPLFLKIYRGLLPPKAGIRVMQNFSKLSRSLGHEQSDPEELNNWAEHILQKKHIDYLVCGHDHHPRNLNFGYGTYINLGTFHLHYSLAAYNNGNISLVTWNKETHAITPFENQPKI